MDYYSVNPIGPSSTLAILIAAFAWFVAERPFRQKENFHRRLAFIAPFSLLALVAYDKISVDSSSIGLHYYWMNRWTQAPELFAGYILVAVSVILSWKAFRLSHDGFKILAAGEVFVAVVFLFLEIFHTIHFVLQRFS